MAAITTPEQVLATTGATVTADQIATAAGVIAANTGIDLTLDPLPYSKRDVRLLRLAVEWQSRYMLGPDADAAIDRAGNLASASANGVAASWGEGGSAGSIIAPLARMALRRLAHRGSRTVRMVAGRPAPSLYGPQTLVSDGLEGSWKPLR